MVLEDICEFIVDCPHSTAPDEGVGYPIIRTPNVGKGRLILEGVQRVSKEAYDKRNARAIPQADDIIFAREAPAGNAAIILEGQEVCLGQRTVLIRPNKEKVDPQFLVYYILAPQQQYELLGTANGATVAHVNIPVIRNLPIDLPSIETQKKIAGIVSAYDDLIENNQKQIKLLEEAVQRLYKEWFVDLRFPGWEDCKIVDGVPEGWERITLNEIPYKLEAGSRPKGGIDNTLKTGIPSIGAENVIGLGQYNYASEKMVTAEYFTAMKRGKIQDRDILIYKDGAYIGRTSLFQDGFPHEVASVNEHVFLLHADDDTLQYYLFFTLYQKEYYMKMQKLNKNAAQPGINQKALQTLDILLPDCESIKLFNTVIEPLMKNIFSKAKQAHQLGEARDRLLPKLMSGEIVV